MMQGAVIIDLRNGKNWHKKWGDLTQKCEINTQTLGKTSSKNRKEWIKKLKIDNYTIKLGRTGSKWGRSMDKFRIS